MIWLTWRQQRTQALTTLAVLAMCAIVLAVTAPSMFQLFDDSGAAACREGCERFLADFKTQVDSTAAGDVYWMGFLVMLVAPALIGSFWGAPTVARELEAGTHRLAWNQSVTSTRWLTVRL